MTGAEQRLRSIKAKIDRLRERVKTAQVPPDLRGVLLGILDLLGDEL